MSRIWLCAALAMGLLSACARTDIEQRFETARKHAKGTTAQREAALKEYEDVLNMSIKAATGEYYLALAMTDQFLQQGFWDKALETAELARSLKPTDAEPYYRLAIAYVNKGRLDRPFLMKGEEAYRRAIELKPEWAQPHYGLAVLLFEQFNRQQEGIEMLKKAVAIHPRYYSAMEKLGQYYFQSAPPRYEAAVAVFTDLIRLDENPRRRADYYYSRGVVQDAAGLAQEAELDYRQALDLNPNVHLQRQKASSP